jgi:hypothetical protein
MRKLGRKFWLFLISLAIIALLAFFDKDATAVIALFSAYCVGNVSTKFATTNANKKEQV